jgi:hypothetical protein
MTGIVDPPADRLYVALRTVASMNGNNDTCSRSTGTLTVTNVEFTPLGCHTPAVSGSVPEAECNSTQTAFMNDNDPDWQPGTGSKVTMVRLTAGATCATVRSTTF